ncbi:Metal transporter CNNM2 [Trichinella spiralis]|uniref:Metal transporter CNNM2 n=1 Tax=Trichinella spiralis TaxID=6334 RepID=A0A0V1AY48_TRISP|nr:Metal transporter CNNM2 [Trichinella spiralis]KRY29695.1 Metal transporter CNNM2 [Trichinella spiralis]
MRLALFYFFIYLIGTTFGKNACDCDALNEIIRRQADSRSQACVCDDSDEPILIGLRIDAYETVVSCDSPGQLTVQADVAVRIRLFGRNMLKVNTILLTESETECIDDGVLYTPSQEFDPFDPESITFSLTFTKAPVIYYVCFGWNVAGSNLLNQSITVGETVHQGRKEFQRISVVRKPKVYYMPLPLQICVLMLLLVMSGLFSGLNLGLMTLDKTDLRIILKCGDKQERKFAEKIYPIRKKGNYLLCSLLLGNVIVNSAISILFDDLTSGVIALVISSLGIVIFGEILPQAICSRYGLAVGAYTVVMTRFFMLLTAPLSWPISKILDKCLGEEVGQIYNKERLLELIRLSKEGKAGDLRDCQEVQIVTGALELARKTVSDVMTNIRDVFMLSSDVVLTPTAVNDIVRAGYTRIPVFEGQNRDAVISILNVKDLALLDPEDLIPLRNVCKFYQHPVRFVLEDTPLSVMLEEFKQGHYHMALVQRIVDDGESDPMYEVVGLVTLEDIIEEIIQAEIMDEFDVIRQRRRAVHRPKSVFIGVEALDGTGLAPDVEPYAVSPQLSLAAYQYLSTTFTAFSEQLMSRSVFDRLLAHHTVHCGAPDQYDPWKLLYQKDQQSDLFVLMLEGRAQVRIGRTDMLFDAGPFHHFGYEALAPLAEAANAASGRAQCWNDGMSLLTASKFTPDYTVRVDRDVVFFHLRAEQYLNALLATMVERGQSPPASRPIVNSSMPDVSHHQNQDKKKKYSSSAQAGGRGRLGSSSFSRSSPELEDYVLNGNHQQLTIDVHNADHPLCQDSGRGGGEDGNKVVKEEKDQEKEQEESGKKRLEKHQ